MPTKHYWKKKVRKIAKQLRLRNLPRHCRRVSLAAGRQQNCLGIALAGWPEIPPPLTINLPAHAKTIPYWNR
jgi:hypothetical protein